MCIVKKGMPSEFKLPWNRRIQTAVSVYAWIPKHALLNVCFMDIYFSRFMNSFTALHDLFTLNT